MDYRDNPFFSVIIPTYNRDYLLPRAIESLLEQTEKNWEAIIIDDGSSDNTKSYANSLCIRDRRFSYIYQENQGQSSARNQGISIASGEYITFLDSDDEYSKDHLSSRMDILLKQPDIELLYGGVEVIGDPYVPDINNLEELIHLDECVIGGTFFFKREALTRIGSFPVVPFGDDALLFSLARQNNLNIQVTNLKTYRYYCNRDDSICKKILNILQ